MLVEIPDREGTYVFYCKPHSDAENPGKDDDDMAGKLTVGR